MKKTVTHLIVGLGKGGAETMLYQVLKYRTNPDLNHRVISLGASHYYEDAIREMGYALTELQLKHKPIRSLFSLFRSLKGTDTLCCWMYHANFLGYLTGRLAGVQKIIWCIRHSNLDPKLNSAMTLRINRICAGWSNKVSTVVYNGNRAREVHEAAGYNSAVGAVVDNGCDCQEYAPDDQAAASLREELRIPGEKKIILSLTKATPIKDIPTFLRAYVECRQKHPDTAAVLCGHGVVDTNENITPLCNKLGLKIGEDVFLLGMRHDVPRLLAACDLYVLHSAGEAFPNSLLQAMACSCLCVTTDVGDARRILAQEDCIVPPETPAELAEKMNALLALPGDQAEHLRGENRSRAEIAFDIRRIVKVYEEKF